MRALLEAEVEGGWEGFLVWAEKIGDESASPPSGRAAGRILPGSSHSPACLWEEGVGWSYSGAPGAFCGRPSPSEACPEGCAPHARVGTRVVGGLGSSSVEPASEGHTLCLPGGLAGLPGDLHTTRCECVNRCSWRRHRLSGVIPIPSFRDPRAMSGLAHFPSEKQGHLPKVKQLVQGHPGI